MKKKLIALIYYLCLLILATMLHAIFFRIIGDQQQVVTSNTLSQANTATMEVDIKVKPPEPDTKVKIKKQNQEDRERKRSQKYTLGKMEAEQPADQVALGRKIGKGLPNLRFSYNGRWKKICHDYYKEIDLIYHPKRSLVVRVEWHGSEPSFTEFNGMNIRDFVARTKGYFADKVKNRKDEFKENPNLQKVFMEVRQRFFPEIPENDLYFIALMPVAEAEDLMEALEKKRNEIAGLSEVEASFILNEEGVKIDIKPIH